MRFIPWIALVLIVSCGAFLGVSALSRRVVPPSAPWKKAIAAEEVVKLNPRNGKTPRVVPPGPPPAESNAFSIPAAPAETTTKPEPASRPPVVKVPKPKEAPARAKADAPEADDGAPIERAAKTLRSSRGRLNHVHSYEGKMIIEDLTGKEPERRTLHWLVDRDNDRAMVEWLDSPAKGRKLTFLPSKPTDPVVVLLGEGEFKTGDRRMPMPPHHPLLRTESRLPIPKLGFDGWLKTLDRAIRAEQGGDRRFGTVQFMGRATPTRTNRPMLILRQTGDPAARLADLPLGAHRDWFFDVEWELPTLVVLTNEKGKELEVHQLQDVKLNPSLTPANLLIP